ncbi:MAG: ABC transporter permease [Bacillaceae bacterium]|nr:ABC transporter permease [Bacillaceae bacterium]
MVIAIFLVSFSVVPGWQVIYLPLLIVIQYLSLIALSLFISYVCVFIRDVDNILKHILRIFFYASPIIWEGGRFAKIENETLKTVLNMNPVAILLDSYRNVLLYHQNPRFLGLAAITVISVITILAMFYYYSRNEHK